MPYKDKAKTAAYEKEWRRKSGEKYKEYRREYTAKNKDHINKLKRERYANDSEYRKRVRVANKKYLSNPKNKHRGQATNKKWRREPKNKQRIRDKMLIQKFGIDQDQYNVILESQSGKCAICGNFPPIGKKLGVDHDHQTKQVRGLLCRACNMALGGFQDSSELLSRATDYIILWQMKEATNG